MSSQFVIILIMVIYFIFYDRHVITGIWNAADQYRGPKVWVTMAKLFTGLRLLFGTILIVSWIPYL